MYTDFITYKLAEGITEDFLRNAADEIVNSWMKNQKGFISWQINSTEENDEYIDTVVWSSKEDALAAQENMKDIPLESDWFKCYEMTSVTSKNATEIIKF